MKSTSLSVRVDDEDAAYLARMHIDGARTPSEKLRALLRVERKRQEGARDAVEAADMFRDLLQPTRRRIRKLESEAGARSDLVKKLYDRLPEIGGVALAGPAQDGADKSQALKEFETATIGELFDFVQDVIELGMAPENRVYDTKIIEKRIEALLKYFEVIKISRQQREG